MIKVVIVDDSLLIREIVKKILDDDPEIQVVASAADPIEARDLIKKHNPDVITLDVEMPKMNGIEFLQKIMRLRPTPVVMLSTLTQRGAETTIQALELGAVDCIGKPTQSGDLEKISDTLCEKVKIAAKAQVRASTANSPSSAAPSGPLQYNGNGAKKLIAIGASTGGVEALRDLLVRFPKNCPPIVITQHMPEMFTKSFAERMDRNCEIRVHESQSGMTLQPGNAYITHGGFHMQLKKRATHWTISHDPGPIVSGHRPSVDVMFNSLVPEADSNIIASVLTGMGKDGAAGLRKLRDKGARTVVQDEASCIVFGMPRVAIELGGAERALPLEKIAQQLLAYAEQ